MNLRALLTEYVDPIEGGPSMPSAFPIEELKERLEALKRENSAYFALCAAMVAVLFLAGLWVALANLGNAAVVGTAFAGVGASMVTAVLLMIRLWREKTAVDMLIAFSIALDPEVVKSIVDVLLRRLLK